MPCFVFFVMIDCLFAKMLDAKRFFIRALKRKIKKLKSNIKVVE